MKEPLWIPMGILNMFGDTTLFHLSFPRNYHPNKERSD